MPQVTYFEHYPHYMGTKNATLTFTQKQFDNMLVLAKAAIKEDKNSDTDDAYIALEDYIKPFEEKAGDTAYALTDALLNYFNSPRRPAAINTALNKKGVWSGEWEEGSHAFSNKGAKTARAAVAKIEAQMVEDDF